MAIQWFPGHMNAAKKKIAENLRNIDVVVELLDARLPKASSNPLIQELREFRQRPALKILNKTDLADPKITTLWLDYFKQNGCSAIDINAKQKTDLAKILKLAQQLAPHRNFCFLCYNCFYEKWICSNSRSPKCWQINAAERFD